ncbi:Thiol-disulfide oxidoreductase ResA [Grimontia celer]|uniref:Thiol-disulfide oxidoreductase ResA n=1 Tax=Grimontia celer TaxID=1796497 RepID=A0A128F6F7_9GAMM|nr:redoxin domain-containing protein [Grimontia celer]CZF82362.1 Thiol-disulfide oxidoreductase ResA [Grimontia celer]
MSSVLSGRTFKLTASEWLNTERPIELNEYLGKVVVIYVFQMLCPGCISHGLPLAKNIQSTFSDSGVQVIGLHSVFEHHDVMTPDALRAFIHEYRIKFPVAIDQPSEHNPIPKTMDRYQFGGTPTLLILDQHGKLRLNHFGMLSDMQVGALIGSLLEEKAYAEAASQTVSTRRQGGKAVDGHNGCDEYGCKV